jgi:hypothetical protein
MQPPVKSNELTDSHSHCTDAAIYRIPLGLGGLLFLTMGGIFYRKYRKRKLKAEGTETSSNIEGKVTSHANAEVVASSSKADNDSTSESESELDVPNMAGRGVSRAKRPTLKTDPASLRRKVSPSASPSTNGSEDDGTPQTERVKTLKHKRKAKKNIKQPVSDPESDYSSTDSSDSTDDSDARLRRKTRQT